MSRTEARKRNRDCSASTGRSIYCKYRENMIESVTIKGIKVLNGYGTSKRYGKEEGVSLGNWKMVLRYDGTRYQGWQKQERTEHTIQGKLESLLSRICGQNIEVQGSGRTDAGVHALGQVAHFHTSAVMNAEALMEEMNHYLPEDIAVISVSEASDRFHSRLHAVRKTYQYRIWNSRIPPVFERKYVYPVAEALDLEAMRKAAAFLIGTNDYRSFTSLKKSKKSMVRTIENIRIERRREEVRLTFEGDGFLYHMVRILTGTLLEVGMGKRQPEDMKDLLDCGRREEAGPLVPAKGLTLVEVHYS